MPHSERRDRNREAHPRTLPAWSFVRLLESGPAHCSGVHLEWARILPFSSAAWCLSFQGARKLSRPIATNRRRGKFRFAPKAHWRLSPQISVRADAGNWFEHASNAAFTDFMIPTMPPISNTHSGSLSSVEAANPPNCSLRRCSARRIGQVLGYGRLDQASGGISCRSNSSIEPTVDRAPGCEQESRGTSARSHDWV